MMAAWAQVGAILATFVLTAFGAYLRLQFSTLEQRMRDKCDELGRRVSVHDGRLDSADSKFERILIELGEIKTELRHLTGTKGF